MDTKKCNIVIINVVISLFITAFLMLMSSAIRTVTNGSNYDIAILFVLISIIAISLQLLINWGFAIYFFIEKENTKGTLHLLSMAILVVLAVISYLSDIFWTKM